MHAIKSVRRRRLVRSSKRRRLGSLVAAVAERRRNNTTRSPANARPCVCVYNSQRRWRPKARPLLFSALRARLGADWVLLCFALDGGMDRSAFSMQVIARSLAHSIHVHMIPTYFIIPRPPNPQTQVASPASD
jgi:hypothetical protein